MPNVLFTDVRFGPNEVFDTRIFCGGNRRAAEAEGRTRLEVEALLESMRAVMTVEHRRATGRDLPGRECGVSAVIWPEDVEYNPPGGPRCYIVKPKSGGAVWAVVDEDWVDLLIERWPGIGREEAYGLAELYWGGVPRHYGPGSSDLLIEGKVEIVSDCPEEEERLRPAPGTPLRQRPPVSRSERIAAERKYGRARGMLED